MCVQAPCLREDASLMVLYLNKTLQYWDIHAVMNSLNPKEGLQRKMKMPGGPSEKGVYLSPFLAFLLAKT